MVPQIEEAPLPYRKFLIALLVLITLSASPAALAQTTTHVLQLPTVTTETSPTGIAYGTTPLTSVATFPAGVDSLGIFVRPTATPAEVTYWIAQRAGTATFRILNKDFQEVRAVNLGINAAAAAMTPDGSKFLILANTVRVMDAATGNEIPTQFMDVGPNPSDMAVSADSRRAFVFSAAAQRVTAIDLQTYQVIGSVSVPGITSGFVSMGPNGLLYVSAETKVLEVLPHATPFDANAVRRTISVTGNIGKLHFTPDGTRAIAANGTSFATTLLYLLNLDPNSGGVATTQATDNLQGLMFDKITMAGNNLAYGVTSASSTAPRRIYQINIPNLPGAGLPLDPATVSEGFFGSIATIPIVDNVSVTREYPRGRYAFISAPLNLLNAASPSTIYQIDLSNNNAISQATMNFTAGLNGPVTAVQTLSTTSAASVITYNSTQPVIAPSGRSLPLGVRVLNIQGLPIFGASVTFTSNIVGVAFEPSATVTTNGDGLAQVRAVAPPLDTNFSVIANVAGTALTGGFNLVSGTGGGGGGGGGTGQSVNVVSGNGQVMKEGEPSRFPYVIEVLDAAGKPVGGATVTWTVTEGGGFLIEGTVTETAGQRTTVTDSLGRTQNVFQAPVSIGVGNSFATSVITAATASSGATLHATTVVRFNSDGTPAPSPSIEIITPAEPRVLNGRAGETLTEAVAVRVTNSAFPAIGAPIPNVGIELRPGSDPATSPSAVCAPKPVALSDTTGLAKCDVKFGGKTGGGYVVLSIGAIGEATININVQPGVASGIVKVSGDGQTGRPGQQLPTQLVAQVQDGGGNPLAGASVRWEILSGTATLNPTSSTSDSSGNVRTTVTLGNQTGNVQIKATVLAGSQPSVLFGATISQVLATITKISGDNQTAFTNAPFAQPLVVELRDVQGAAVVGSPVNFAVASGPATIQGSGAVSSDSQGRALVTVQAGATSGTVTVTATAGSLPAVSFTLTVRLPGPVFDAGSFRNVASNQVGVVPLGIVRILARGVATGINGVVQANFLLGPLPTRLRDVEVQFGSSLAPIFQLENINGQEAVVVQAPADLVGPGTVPVTIRVGSASTLVNGVQVLEVQPGVFETVDQQNRRFAVLLRPNGTYVSPDNPARWGELIRGYFTSGGSMLDPRANTGQTGVPGQRLINQVIVGVNDAGVRVVSAQYAVGMIGVYEVIFEVPQGTTVGSDRPFAIAVVNAAGQSIFGNGSRIAIGQ
jgi:hypothetical protein